MMGIVSFLGIYKYGGKHPNGVFHTGITENRYSTAIAITLLGSLLMLVWYVFSPGITGDLVLDDHGTFSSFRQAHQVEDVESFLAFCFGELSGPLRRALTMATFFLDTQTWPIDTIRLKRSNILYHLINTTFVFWVSLLLLNFFMPSESNQRLLLLSLLISGLWSMNPMQVSTVSYMVQRMAQLSALFILIGLVIVIKFTQHLLSDKSLRVRHLILYGSLYSTVIVMGVFAKENAILLSLFGLITSLSMIHHHVNTSGALDSPITTPYAVEKAPLWLAWKILFYLTPLLLLTLYIVNSVLLNPESYAFREFSLTERLLTQTRIVLIYIKSILLPDIDYLGLANVDRVIASKSLWNPISTLFSLITVTTIFFIAVKYRERWPLLSYGILFFFAAHALESTLLPLELYYEHRNYLAIFGIAILLVALLYQSIPDRNLSIIILCILLIGSASIAHQYATRWGDHLTLTQGWFKVNPSSRNSAMYSNALKQSGNDQLSLAVLREGAQHHPDSLSMQLNLYYAECMLQRAKPFPLKRFQQLARLNSEDGAWIGTLEKLWDHIKLGQPCPGFHIESLISLLDTAVRHNRLIMSRDNRASQIYLLKARYSEYKGDLLAVIDHLERSCHHECTSSVRLSQAVFLVRLGRVEDAHRYIQLAREELTLQEHLRRPDLKEKIAQLEKYLAEK